MTCWHNTFWLSCFKCNIPLNGNKIVYKNNLKELYEIAVKEYEWKKIKDKIYCTNCKKDIK